MDLQLSNLLPEPLKDQDVGDSTIWLKDVTLSGGNSYLIKAASGKGKTTLLSILYGIRHDYEGDVTFDGRSMASLSSSEWATLRQSTLSMVFQDLLLFSELTVMENLLIKNQLTDHKTREDITSLIAKLGMGDFEQQKVGLLSLGQQQRIAIIRALCQPFKVLLLDEPFSHLDNENVTRIREVIEEEVANNQATLIISTLEEEEGFSYNQTFSV